MISEKTFKKNLYGISFDSIPVSGVIVEFLKIAEIFKERGCDIFLDLGYYIKADKNNFRRRYTKETNMFPSWIKLTRLTGINSILGYTEAFVRKYFTEVITKQSETISDELSEVAYRIEKHIEQIILKEWFDLNISFVIVENGTLPENPIFTRALKNAINIYGKCRGLGKYVLWRDHDMMWTSEFLSNKYGSFPYPHVPKPLPSKYINYIVQHDYNKQKIKHWCPNAEISVIPNSFSFIPAKITANNRNFRKDFGIGNNDYLISRCTRIIPQKRIDRDIKLIYFINKLLIQKLGKHKAYLLIAGCPNESREEIVKLKHLVRALKLEKFVIFAGSMRQNNKLSDYENTSGYSIQDLLAHTDLNSFLTSSDYESFGNPIGEAIAAKVPFMTSRYKMYDMVYGNKGFKGLVFDFENGDSVNPETAQATLEVLENKKRIKEIVEHNYKRGKKYFSLQNYKQIAT